MSGANEREMEYYLGLGGNLGHTRSLIDGAMSSLAGIGVVSARSAIYKSKAWGVEEQPDYLNMVCQYKTGLNPTELLDSIQAIEKQFGRDRSVEKRWGPRTLDIDILWWSGGDFRTEDLTIPHKYWKERPFVVIPLLEIAKPSLRNELERSFSKEEIDSFNAALIVV